MSSMTLSKSLCLLLLQARHHILIHKRLYGLSARTLAPSTGIVFISTKAQCTSSMDMLYFPGGKAFRCLTIETGNANLAPT